MLRDHWIKLKCGHIRKSFLRNPKGMFYCIECKALVEVDGPTIRPPEEV